MQLHTVYEFNGAAVAHSDLIGTFMMLGLAVLFVAGGASEGWSRGRAGGGLGHFLLLCAISLVPLYVAYRFHSQIADDRQNGAWSAPRQSPLPSAEWNGSS